jgi:ketosteroid isomerase-like protein
VNATRNARPERQDETVGQTKMSIGKQWGVYVVDTKTSLSMCALLIAFTPPAFAQDARSIADAANAKWLQLYNKGDAAGLTALYTKDAVVVLPTAAEPIIGAVNVRKMLDADLAHPAMGLMINSTESRMLDANTIIDAGTWAGDFPGEKGAAPMHINGAYAVVFVHQGSDWLLRVDSTSMAPPPPK